MGIDICLFVEFYDETDKVWRLVKWDETLREFLIVQIDEEPEQAPGDDEEQYEKIIENWRDTFPLGDLRRCYKLFALLSGMRNEYDIIPYSNARGIPDDISPSSRIIVNANVEEELQDRECSWLNGRELRDIYENDVVRPNSVLHREYKQGFLEEFAHLVQQLNESHRIIFWYG